jgi:P-type Ca2+ transporter type 2C
MFANRWLMAAVALSLFMHVLVIHVPFLQTAFHTMPLSLGDWLIAAAVGAVLLVVMELVKALRKIERRAPARVAP